MRRIAVLLVALFLVNLPVVDEALTSRRVAREGREVAAEVVDARRIGQGWYLDLRLPEEVDPRHGLLSARVDAATYAAARRSRTIEVRVVPGDPSSSRVAGQVGNRLFTVVAIGGDLLFLVAAVLWWRRRRWRRFRVEDVGQDTVTLARDGLVVTATAPERWLLRTRAGQHVAGTLHLTAEQDVLGTSGSLGPAGLQARGAPAYVVRGWVGDVSPGLVRLEVADGLRVGVQTGPHRNRADLRELATTSGILHFTPGL